MNDFTTTLILMIIPALFAVLAYVLSPYVKEMTNKNVQKAKGKDASEENTFGKGNKN